MGFDYFLAPYIAVSNTGLTGNEARDAVKRLPVEMRKLPEHELMIVVMLLGFFPEAEFVKDSERQAAT